jgi:two-component system cell cycle sensor histidine kinase/response regulator CckA
MATAPRQSSQFTARVAVVVILLVGGLASIQTFYDAHDREISHATAEFERSAAILHSLTREVIGDYETSLFALQEVLSANGGASQADFARAARSLAARNPGIKAFEWVPVVSAEGRAAMEAALTRTHGRTIEFMERTATGGLVRDQVRPEYYPIFYVEPLQGNEPAVGFDLKSAPTFADQEAARRTRQAVLSGQVKLVQEGSDKLGVILIRPIFRPTPGNPSGATSESDVFVGFVQAVFVVPEMLETARNRTLDSSGYLDTLFVDEGERNPARRILYYRPSILPAAGQPATSEPEFARGLHREQPLKIGGRNWKVIYRPRAGWIQEQVTLLPWVRSTGVLAITCLLAGIVHLLGRRSAIIAREVTERTAELDESRRLLDSLLHALPAMAYRREYGATTRVVYVSDGATALTGHSSDDFIWGKVHFRDLIHPEDLPRVRAATRAGLQERREVEVEYRLRVKDGTEKWVLSRAHGVYAADGQLQFLEGLALDVTASKQGEANRLAIERKLLDGQKLESLGLMAGGIAHDFNNILTGILGNANLARFKAGEDSIVVPHLLKIEHASARAAELCQQMLAYSGRSSFVVEPVDLSQMVQDTLPLLNVSLASRARLCLNLSDRPVVVMADVTQIRQIIMNLVINAADAVGDRHGEIHIATGTRVVDQEFLRAASDGDLLASGPYAYVEVRDTGCGMTPETIAKIFDPFFTTKFAGRGLGLAAVRGIVRSHQGALHVASTPGQGSTFTLLLPPSQQESVAAAAAPVAPRQYSGKVLVIDDEAAVRETAAGLMATFGFTVVTANNGSNGIVQFCAGPSDYVLVLLDLTMPGLSGDDTLATLRTIAPDVRVLLISGYSDSARATQLAANGPVGFLQKPFTREALERKLRELLG